MAFAAAHHFERSYGSYEELARDDAVDIVYVATPHPFHLRHAVLCMEFGKAVLCEKPVAVNAEQARQLAECAKKNNVFFMEGMWTRHFPVNIEVKRLIGSGALGQIALIQADFGFGAWDSCKGAGLPERLASPAMAGGSLLDVGIYCVSYASCMTGRQPRELSAAATMLETGVDGMSACLMKYDDGAMAMLESSIALPTRQTALIYCERALIEVPNFWHPDHAVVHYHQAGREDERIDIPYAKGGAAGFIFEIEEATRCMLAGLNESPAMTWRESVGVMETMDRIREAIGLRFPFEQAGPQAKV
jgi:predicted dehydrogenase